MMKEISLRKVCFSDIHFVFELANDKIVRETAFTTEEIQWEDHVNWFENQLNCKKQFYIIECDNQACGYIRFQEVKECTRHMLLTIAILPSNRGSGIAKIIIPIACKKILVETSTSKIIAMVKHQNLASAKVFLQCDFIENKNQKKYREFHYPYI